MVGQQDASRLESSATAPLRLNPLSHRQAHRLLETLADANGASSRCINEMSCDHDYLGEHSLSRVGRQKIIMWVTGGMNNNEDCDPGEDDYDY